MLRGAGLVESQEDGMAKDKETVDVLVVGAGASGGAFTWSLAEAGSIERVKLRGQTYREV